MECFWENQTKRFLSIDEQDIQVATFKELSKEIRPSQAMLALCFQVAQMEPQANIHPSMQVILQEFFDLFIELISLPLTRELTTASLLKKELS